jgi:hypothetical protein
LRYSFDHHEWDPRGRSGFFGNVEYNYDISPTLVKLEEEEEEDEKEADEGEADEYGSDGFPGEDEWGNTEDFVVYLA